ncbi:MAG TPA: hypothetical protein ENN05_12195 [Deltaproteobacteria bacterium]|nr:hypothetical protein [Deltaproteobacteria bacterium]
MDFVHPVLNEEVLGIGGHYMFIREDLIDHSAGDILYLVGYALTDTSCCGVGGCGYALVAGHIVCLHVRLGEDNRHISMLSPVQERFYPEVGRAVAYKEGVGQVHFLLETGEMKVWYRH